LSAKTKTPYDYYPPSQVFDACFAGLAPPLVGSIQLADIAVLRLQYLSFIDSVCASSFAALVFSERH
jgi:hypothetical protein